MISFGVALASRGELRFNLIGFLTQAAAVAVRTFFLPSACPRTFHLVLIWHGAIARTNKTVRGFSSRNDPNSLTRPQDGSPCLAPLLRARLRPHQPRHPSIYGRIRALL